MLRLLAIMDIASESAGWGEETEQYIGRNYYVRTFCNYVDIRSFDFKTGAEKMARGGIIFDSFVFAGLVENKNKIYELWPALKCGTLCHKKPVFDCYECNPGLAGRGFKP